MSRLTKLFSALTLIAVLVAVFAFVAPALAASNTFNVSVYHGINGKDLGLSSDLPVKAYIYKDGELLANVPLKYKERITTNLPAGNYTIKVYSDELKKFIPSMQVGPVEIPAGAKVRLNAHLGAGNTPQLIARVK